VNYYCEACHKWVDTCAHTQAERDAWRLRARASFLPWQCVRPPGLYATCPACKSPTVTLHGTGTGHCYACGHFDQPLVDELMKRAAQELP
jgi:hypothetical protein